MKFMYIETIEDKLSNIEIKKNQIVYACDIRKSFFDIEDEITRISLDAIIYLTTEADKELISIPLKNRIYYIKDTSNAYKFDGISWIIIDTQQDFLEIAFSSDDFVAGVVASKGIGVLNNNLAPKTLARYVYNSVSGESLIDSINNAQNIVVSKSKSVYVNAVRDKQTLFDIPFPLNNYDLETNKMIVISKGYDLEGRYIVKGNTLILTDAGDALNSGEFILFIFFYYKIYDINSGVVLHSKNIAEMSITSDKISKDFLLDAAKIDTTDDMMFVTKNEIQKWNALTGTEKIHPDQINEAFNTLLIKNSILKDLTKNITNFIKKDELGKAFNEYAQDTNNDIYIILKKINDNIYSNSTEIVNLTQAISTNKSITDNIVLRLAKLEGGKI